MLHSSSDPDAKHSQVMSTSSLRATVHKAAWCGRPCRIQGLLSSNLASQRVEGVDIFSQICSPRCLIQMPSIRKLWCSSAHELRHTMQLVAVVCLLLKNSQLRSENGAGFQFAAASSFIQDLPATVAQKWYNPATFSSASAHKQAPDSTSPRIFRGHPS